MTELRKRAAFRFASDSTEDEDNHVLDEQGNFLWTSFGSSFRPPPLIQSQLVATSTEQEELIASLQNENLTSNQRYLSVLQVTVALSCLLHLIFLVNPKNPLLVLSSDNEPDTSIPLLIPLTFLSIMIHLNLGLLLYPRMIDITPLSYLPLFGISAISPCLSILLGRSWLTIAWWSVAGGVVWVAYSVQRWIENGNQSIAELEGMKYVAPGA